MASLIAVPCRRCSLGRIGNAISNFSPPMHKLSTDSLNVPYSNHGSLSSSKGVSHFNSLWRFGDGLNNGSCVPSTAHHNGNMACCAAASLELEALAAVQQISNAVQDISVSEMLPRTSQLIFVNVTTWEGQPYCLELTSKGWRITSLRSDCMQGDFTRMELFTHYYENLLDLLKVISPEAVAAIDMSEISEDCESNSSSFQNSNIFNNNFNEMPNKTSKNLQKCKSLDYENNDIDELNFDDPITPKKPTHSQKFNNCAVEESLTTNADENDTTLTMAQVSKMRAILNGNQNRLC